MTTYDAHYPDLAGKVAVVTGGSRGLGAESARALARNGALVVVSGRDESAIGAVLDDIRRAEGLAIGCPADVTDATALARLRDVTQREFGPADILLAFAAGGRARPGPIHTTTEADWRSTVDGSLTSTFLTLKTFLPDMADRGSGSVLTMASLAARRAATGAPAAYIAAKAGVVALTKEAAAQYGPRNVRINCLSPSTVRTEQIERVMPEEFRERVTALHPLRRLGLPADVAAVTLFLASSASSWLTGLTVDVDGGRTLV
ncbi:SDR family NAD(P)-dependent oxidoreductase [Asanoa sp. NPDC049573]|uniref:SDR family NAD(P)-dependent oxidoreductase n=1 Tax=Asanoa sp. NPDC049573 TaxID=3155396 RepID=UPI0034145C46